MEFAVLVFGRRSSELNFVMENLTEPLPQTWLLSTVSITVKIMGLQFASKSCPTESRS